MIKVFRVQGFRNSGIKGSRDLGILGFYWIKRDVKGFKGILRGFMGFLGILRGLKGSKGF